MISSMPDRYISLIIDDFSECLTSWLSHAGHQVEKTMLSPDTALGFNPAGNAGNLLCARKSSSLVQEHEIASACSLAHMAYLPVVLHAPELRVGPLFVPGGCCFSCWELRTTPSAKVPIPPNANGLCPGLFASIAITAAHMCSLLVHQQAVFGASRYLSWSASTMTLAQGWLVRSAACANCQEHAQADLPSQARVQSFSDLALRRGHDAEFNP